MLRQHYFVTRFAFENDKYSENKCLPRIVGNLDDDEFVYNHLAKTSTKNVSSKILFIAQSRKDHAHKRRYKIEIEEEA